MRRGFGAAVQAYDNNLSAIVLEKQPEESAGGDVRCCGGYLFPISTDPNVLMSTGSFGEANEDLVYGIDEYGTDAIDWLVAHKYMEWADQPYVVIDGAGPGIYKGLLQAAIDARGRDSLRDPGLISHHQRRGGGGWRGGRHQGRAPQCEGALRRASGHRRLYHE